MTETCKNCRKTFDSGIWISPQFNDKKVILFCSSRCKNEYTKIKLRRIKAEYPKYYNKLMKSAKNKIKHE